MDDVSNFCPAMAVPITVKIPEPITAPIPRAVKETGPSVFFSLRSGSSESEISLSMDLQQKSWLSEVRTLAAGGSVVGCAKRLTSPETANPSNQHKHLASQHHKLDVRRLSAKCQGSLLPLRRASRQLLHFPFLRSASVLARLERMLSFMFFAGRAFSFLAFVFA